MAKELSLFEQACGKLRIGRVGPLTMLVIDGQGLGCCLTGDFSPVEKWARSKKAGPNATIDAGKIIEKVDVMVCRAGTTFASTKGSTKPLESIAKAMRQAGMDLKEFSLPPELKDMGKPVDQVLEAMEAKKKKDAAAAAAAAAAQGTGEPKP
jgi:hypothetical protein